MAENDRRKGESVLLLALAAGTTTREAARQAGIGERTATRRLADPGFRQRVQDTRAALVERTLGKLARGSTKAADTLRRLLKSESDSVKLGAARALLEIGSKLRESVELENRIAELERKHRLQTP
jgi:HEAT repeat protein